MSAQAKFYDEIGKDSNDLITKGFPADSTLKVIVDTQTPNGVNINATARRFLKGTEQVEVAVEPKYNWKEKNVEASCRFSTSDNYEGTVTVKEPGKVAGSKFTLTGISGNGTLGVKGALSFKNDNLAVKLNAHYPLSEGNPLKLSGSAAVQYPSKFFWGVDVSYDLPHEKVSDRSDKTTKVGPVLNWNAAGGWSDENGTQLHTYVQNKPAFKDQKQQSVLGIGWIQKVTDAVKFAFDFNLEANQIRDPIATVAGEYRFDSTTTLRSKLSVKKVKTTDFRLGLGATQKLSSNLTATLGSDLNMSQLLGSSTGNPHSFGFELKFQ